MTCSEGEDIKTEQADDHDDRHPVPALASSMPSDRSKQKEEELGARLTFPADCYNHLRLHITGRGLSRSLVY
jgi:hypothetical protein